MSMNVLCDHHHSSGRRGTFRAAGAVVGSVVAAAEEPWGADRAVQNVDDLRDQPPALGWMGEREKAPKTLETAVLSNGSNIGIFWRHCKRLRRCGRPPYDLLLINPVLRADYRCHHSDTRKLLSV